MFKNIEGKKIFYFPQVYCEEMLKKLKEYFRKYVHIVIILSFFKIFPQEIDGQSLLLMKRSDVLTGLYIRLGPALKLYQHVLKLQSVGLDNSLF